MTAFLILLAVHWFADFVLQTHWQAQNKSKNNEALFRHVLVYTWTLGTATMFVFGPGRLGEADGGLRIIGFILANGLLHFATDYVTSRGSAVYFGKSWHNFFVVIGFDQLIHQVTIALTMKVFFGWTT